MMPDFNTLEQTIKQELEAYQKRNSNWFFRLFRSDTWGNRHLSRVNQALAFFESKPEGQRVPLNKVMGMLICNSDSTHFKNILTYSPSFCQTRPLRYNEAGNNLLDRLWDHISNADVSTLRDSFFHSANHTVSWNANSHKLEASGLSLAVHWPHTGLNRLKTLFEKFIGRNHSNSKNLKIVNSDLLADILQEQVLGQIGFHDTRYQYGPYWNGRIVDRSFPRMRQYTSVPGNYDPQLMTMFLETLNPLDSFSQLEILSLAIGSINQYELMNNSVRAINEFCKVRQDGIKLIKTRRQEQLQTISPNSILPKKYTKSLQGLLRLVNMGVDIEPFTNQIDFFSVFSSSDALVYLTANKLENKFHTIMKAKFREMIQNRQGAASSSSSSTESLLDILCKPGENNGESLFATFVSKDSDCYHTNSLLEILESDIVAQDALITSLLPVNYHATAPGSSSSFSEESAASKIAHWFNELPEKTDRKVQVLIKRHLENMKQTLVATERTDDYEALGNIVKGIGKLKLSKIDYRVKGIDYMIVALNYLISLPANGQTLSFAEAHKQELQVLIQSIANFIPTLYEKNLLPPLDKINLLLDLLNKFPTIFPEQAKMGNQKNLIVDLIYKIFTLREEDRKKVLNQIADKGSYSDELFVKILQTPVSPRKPQNMLEQVIILNKDSKDWQSILDRAVECNIATSKKKYSSIKPSPHSIFRNNPTTETTQTNNPKHAP